MFKNISVFLVSIAIIVFIGHNSSLANTRLVTNLVVPVSYFVDHVKELNDLKSNLDKYRQASIVGTSGIGKTQLARTYAYEYKDKYKFIWFLDCNLDMNQEFIKLAKILNLERKANIPEQGNMVITAVLDYLQDKDDWLLVFDNLKISKNDKVKDITGWEHNGHVIFTSQDKRNLPYIIELVNFKKNDCVALAEAILKNSSKDQAEFLATNLNGYPILVVQTAQLFNQIKGLNLEVYKKMALETDDKIKLNISLAIDNLTPTAVDLLSQIALINNQSFSKDFLSYITSHKTSLDDDIYQISRFILISNIDSNEFNSVFEMHDVIAQTIVSLIGDKKTKELLKKTIDNLLLSTPETIAEFHVFRSGKTVFENFKITAENAEKYNIDLMKSMELKSYLMIQYNNYSDYYGAESLVTWFNENDAAKKFKPSSMNNDERARYADFLGSIARYYRNRYSDFTRSMEYNLKAAKVFENVKGYTELKADIYYQLALNELKVGNLDKVAQYVLKLENTPFVDNIEAMLFYLKGQYNKALEKIDYAIKIRLSKIKPNDLVLTSNYLLRAQILNFLGQFQEAYAQTIQLYDLHKAIKKEDHLIFGKIFTQLARSELGLKKTDEALGHITKALSIFLSNKKSSSKANDISEDPELANSYTIQGDILSAKGDFKLALESYRAAQKIYFYLYKNNSANIAQVSALYLNGSKAACKLKDLYHYKAFGIPQVREFGREHVNTRAMFEYCKQQGMDLWAD